MDGIINVLKPIGMTSTDVVRWLTRKTKEKKAGHIGTLDPGAAGILPICLGKATRLAEYHTAQNKSYRAEITLGISTDTQDAFGQEVSRVIPQVTKEAFTATLEKFLGAIEQEPPMYSAVRKDGKHLYEYARQGIEFTREKRQVTIHSLKLIEWYEDIFPRALFDIDCSKGTYIRTLCLDIGNELGCGAHMSFLLRLDAGKFTLDNSYTLEEIARCLAAGDERFLLAPEWGLPLPAVKLPAHRLAAFKNGLSTDYSRQEIPLTTDKATVQVFCENRFIGIGTWENHVLTPSKVMV
ncbi:tRNA pseudouridine(55) synthase TruB [Dehalobacter sp. DCM]|uniref:tRNA pseudouridine(55) synthase TruB n=1 Tax=Dehalobacter sp. DCM TaxID=2907827 RepID=UPI003081CA51|nr:tRNA pseudouridine(55) synthase TruB [Dehalobacter sp. DCM]